MLKKSIKALFAALLCILTVASMSLTCTAAYAECETIIDDGVKVTIPADVPVIQYFRVVDSSGKACYIDENGEFVQPIEKIGICPLCGGNVNVYNSVYFDKIGETTREIMCENENCYFLGGGVDNDFTYLDINDADGTAMSYHYRLNGEEFELISSEYLEMGNVAALSLDFSASAANGTKMRAMHVEKQNPEVKAAIDRIMEKHREKLLQTRVFDKISNLREMGVLK